MEARYLAVVNRGSDRGTALCVTGVIDSQRPEIVKVAGAIVATLRVFHDKDTAR